jgi:hypothetical protein
VTASVGASIAAPSPIPSSRSASLGLLEEDPLELPLDTAPESVGWLTCPPHSRAPNRLPAVPAATSAARDIRPIGWKAGAVQRAAGFAPQNGQAASTHRMCRPQFGHGTRWIDTSLAPTIPYGSIGPLASHMASGRVASTARRQNRRDAAPSRIDEVIPTLVAERRAMREE